MNRSSGFHKCVHITKRQVSEKFMTNCCTTPDTCICACVLLNYGSALCTNRSATFPLSTTPANTSKLCSWEAGSELFRAFQMKQQYPPHNFAPLAPLPRLVAVVDGETHQGCTARGDHPIILEHLSSWLSFVTRKGAFLADMEHWSMGCVLNKHHSRKAKHSKPLPAAITELGAGVIVLSSHRTYIETYLYIYIYI